MATTSLKTNGKASTPSETARQNLKNAPHKHQLEQHKIAIKATDIFGNDTMNILEKAT